MVKCHQCANKGIIRRPKTGQPICKDCFFQAFENEVHQTIVESKMFTRGERVAIAASGGKDSTVLAHIIKTLNDRHDYGLDLFLLSVDEGISGYRDDSLETVKRNQVQYSLPLKIVSYEELYGGWTMDAIVKSIGQKNNCTFCGVFRRQALDRGAALMQADHILTGHNADDIAETVLMNVLRGDIARLGRCTAISTHHVDKPNTVGTTEESVEDAFTTVPRSKPFKYTYEKEIVMYAYFKKLDYFSTECIYSPNAYRGHARAFLKDLESLHPAAILDIIRSGEAFEDLKEKSEGIGGGKSATGAAVKKPVQRTCERCGYISSNKLCKACVLLDGLNSGTAQLANRS